LRTRAKWPTCQYSAWIVVPTGTGALIRLRVLKSPTGLWAGAAPLALTSKRSAASRRGDSLRRFDNPLSQLTRALGIPIDRSWTIPDGGLELFSQRWRGPTPPLKERIACCGAVAQGRGRNGTRNHHGAPGGVRLPQGADPLCRRNCAQRDTQGVPVTVGRSPRRGRAV
jgi:hypothetical protein